ncbi:MAG: putative RNA methyltransferase [Christensenellaceae bacterium]
MGYVCPHCKHLLERREKSLVCPSGHAFDLAGEGYVNLLPVNRKKKKDPGDNREMCRAREEFLSKGYFDRLLEGVKDRCAGVTLDAGCGTGYYLRGVSGACTARYGVDISKHAVALAAKRDREGSYAVASVFAMPFEDETFDTVLNVFAPKPEAEFLRVLRGTGRLVEVVPGQAHLIELKSRLYCTARENGEKAGIGGFVLEGAEEIRYERFVEKEDLLHLWDMTPYRYKTEAGAKEALAGTEGFAITFDFLVRTWKKAK